MIYRDFESNKLGDMAIGQAGAGHYSWAALSSNDSKTRTRCVPVFPILLLLLLECVVKNILIYSSNIIMDVRGAWLVNPSFNRGSARFQS